MVWSAMICFGRQDSFFYLIFHFDLNKLSVNKKFDLIIEFRCFLAEIEAKKVHIQPAVHMANFWLTIYNYCILCKTRNNREPKLCHV